MIATVPRGRWASLEQAAAYLAVSRATLYRLLDRGHVAAAKVGTRRLVDLDSVDAHLDRCRADLGIPAPVATIPNPTAGAQHDAALSPEV